MGKTKEQHETEVLEVIIKNKIMKVSHIFQHYTDLKSAQFYNLELEKSEAIKEQIRLNRTKAVSYLLNKWIASDNATLQISAFKVVCEDDERKKLSMQYVESDNNHNIQKFEIEVIDENKNKQDI